MCPFSAPRLGKQTKILSSRVKKCIERLYKRALKGSRVTCFNEFRPVEVRPHHGRAWRPVVHPTRIRATYRRLHGVRHYILAYDVRGNKLWMRRYKRKRWQEILDFLKYIRRKFPPEIKFCVILDNWSPHRCKGVMSWAAKANVVFVFTPTYASWFNKIEGIFSGLRPRKLGLSKTTTKSPRRSDVRWRNTRPDHPKPNKLENSS